MEVGRCRVAVIRHRVKDCSKWELDAVDHDILTVTEASILTHTARLIKHTVQLQSKATLAPKGGGLT